MKSSCSEPAPRVRWWSVCWLLLGACLVPGAAAASEFSAFVGPPRFTLEAKPGDVVRQTVTIGNGGVVPASYRVRSGDWSLNEAGGVRIHPVELQEDSCRPWLRLERPQINLAPRQTRRYRFEIHVPGEAPVGECRVALVIEPDDAATAQAGPLAFPVAGRIAVIVYVNVGGAKPDLVIRETRWERQPAGPGPVLRVSNQGRAHGRLQGTLDAEDARGRSYRLLVSTLPVLPGETRNIPIYVKERDGSDAKDLPQLPLRIRGEVFTPSGRERLNVTLR
jgi:fimbrial chaperone protein